MSREHVKLDRRRQAAWRKRILTAAGHRCQQCGKAGRLEADHVTPLHLGGAPYDDGNGQALCVGCHIAKTAGENRRPLTPSEQRWRDLIEEIAP